MGAKPPILRRRAYVRFAPETDLDPFPSHSGDARPSATPRGAAEASERFCAGPDFGYGDTMCTAPKRCWTSDAPPGHGCATWPARRLRGGGSAADPARALSPGHWLGRRAAAPPARRRQGGWRRAVLGLAALALRSSPAAPPPSVLRPAVSRIPPLIGFLTSLSPAPPTS